MLNKLSLPVQLCIIIIATLLLGSYIPLTGIRFFYTTSLVFKEILGFLLPFIIFTFVFTGLASLKRNAPAILAVILAAIFISNGCVALITYWIGRLFLPFLVGTVCVEGLGCAQGPAPFFVFELPRLISSGNALLLAIILGLFFGFLPVPAIERGVGYFKKQLESFFSCVFIPFLPLYVFGFLLEIQYKGVLLQLIKNYGGAFFLIVAWQWCCLIIFYWVAAGFDLKAAVIAIRNALGSYLTGFSTMSSTMTVPVSIEAAEKNTGNSALAQVAMPIMANVHLLGDSISTPLLALVTMLVFFGVFPPFVVYVAFAWKFCWSMFAVSGVPAGGILVMVPVLQTYLGFTDAMISIIMTLYILLDAFGTSANVMGDGALVMMVNNSIKKLKLV